MNRVHTWKVDYGEPATKLYPKTVVCSCCRNAALSLLTPLCYAGVKLMLKMTMMLGGDDDYDY